MDPVFVSRFETVGGIPKSEGQRLRGVLEQTLVRRFIVVDRADIPDYEEYSAEVYLDSCPPGQNLGCAHVIGERAGAEWVVTGQVSPGEAGPKVTVTYLAVKDARVVFTFSAEVDPENEQVFANGVGDVLDKIVGGAAAEEDLRGKIVAPEDLARMERSRQEEIAASLAELDGELAVMDRSFSGRDIEPPKLTRDDLEKLRDREDVSPWERFGMKEREYLHFRNSGKSIQEWRRKKNGRFGQVLMSLGFGGGKLPFGHEYDARWALDSTTLEVIERDVYQEVNTVGGLFGEVEVGYGVTPYLQVTGGFNWRSGPYSYLFHSETEDESLVVVNDPSVVNVSTWQVGGRLLFAPFPVWPARPVVIAGVGYWKGASVTDVLGEGNLPASIATLEPFPAPSFVIVEAGLGAEADVAKFLSLYVHGVWEQPLGERLWTVHTGAETLSKRGTPDHSDAGGLQVSAGVRVRIATGPRWPGARAAAATEEDLPDDLE